MTEDLESIIEGTLFDGVAYRGPSRIRIAGGRIRTIAPWPAAPGGRTITPGFVDAHLHLTAMAEALLKVDLSGLGRDGVLEALAAAAAVGGWVRAAAFSPRAYGGFPDRHVLDRLRPEPMAVWGADLHTIIFNTAAIRELGVHVAADIPGGTIERGADGFPTGVVRERAEEVFARRVPPPPDAALKGALQKARGLLLAEGVTGVVTYELPSGLALLEGWNAGGVEIVPFGYREEVVTALAQRGPEGIRRYRGVKMFLDGTLGSRTAWMKDPFDDTRTCGTSRFDLQMAGDLEACLAAGLIPSFHAIGDAAFKAGLSLLAGRPGRIEHIQVVDPSDLERVTPHLVASVQPAHMASDRLEAPGAWGRRIRHAYPYRSLAEAGARLIFGSDAPVVAPSPLAAIAWAVDRRASPKEEAFVPEEAISVEAALAAHTQAACDTLGIGPGRLAKGAPATLCVVDGDLTTAEGREGARVLATYVRGEEVYRSSSGGD